MSAPDTDNEQCPICRGQLIEKKLKKFCQQCGQLCETCCDNGSCQNF